MDGWIDWSIRFYLLPHAEEERCVRRILLWGSAARYGGPCPCKFRIGWSIARTVLALRTGCLSRCTVADLYTTTGRVLMTVGA